MKNLIRKSLLIVALTGTSFAMAPDSSTTMETAENEEYRIIRFSDLNKNEIESFCQAKMEGVIVSIEGAIISLSVVLDSDLLEVGKHTTPCQVKVVKPCFIRCEGGLHLFSSDFRIWKSFKQFFCGKLDSTFDIDEETNLVNLNLHVELYQQK